MNERWHRRPTDEDGLFWMLTDDAGFAWVGNGLTRGKAVARVAEHFEVPFISCRARRVFGRWAHLQQLVGWDFVDGTLTPCEKDHPEAEPFWEVIAA